MATDVTVPADRLGVVESSIAGLTTAEKLELIERIARSIRSGTAPQVGPTDPAERAEWQYQNRMKLLDEIRSFPTVPNEDGFSNRDHDKILYGSP